MAVVGLARMRRSGGSEPGVIAGAYLVETVDDRWFSVGVTVSDAKAPFALGSDIEVANIVRSAIRLAANLP